MVNGRALRESRQQDAEERFKELQHAYDVLSDEEKRKAYDRFGAQNGRAAPAGVPAGSAAKRSPRCVTCPLTTTAASNASAARSRLSR